MLNRNEEIRKDHAAGITQTKIAYKFNITRQRVNQIEKSLGLNRHKEIVESKYVCAHCSKSFGSLNKVRKYCSKKCSSTARRVVRTKKEQYIYDEELREKKRIRARSYYHKIVNKIQS